MALQDAWSGTFDTSNQYVKFAIEMIENSTDINGNLSNITVNVWAWRTNSYGPTYGSGTLYCTIAGIDYTASVTPSQQIGTSKICLFSKNVNVGHNGDGTGRVDIYTRLTMDVVTSGTNGWGFGLTNIPRASIPTLSVGTQTMGQVITISTNRKSTAYTHTLVVVFGGYTANIAFNVTDNFAWTLPIAELCAQIPSATSGWGGITCHTYNGGTLIGSNTVNFTALVPSSVVPTASGLSVAIDGTGRDKTLAKYIQSISKVSASFSSAGIYGSTISSNVINVKRQSDNGDSQNISGASGVIANPFALSGTYIITATTTDSRGRTASVTTTITVDAYSLPTILAFSAGRGSPTTTVNATLNLSWSPIGTSNPATVTVTGKNNVGTVTTLYTLTNSTIGTVNTTQAYTGQSDTSSYTYTLTVTDSFGKVATAVITIGVSFVEFCISKGQGVGVGKIWEQGALDVGGLAVFNGPEKSPMVSSKLYKNMKDYSASGTCTGTIKITLPKSWSSTMMNLVIKGYEYTTTGGAWELTLGGYNYINQTIWYNFSAELNGRAPFTRVRFGHDGTNCCILLGDTTTQWQYPKIVIAEMLASHSGLDGWESGWNISLITSETGITVSGTVNVSNSILFAVTQSGQIMTPNAWHRVDFNPVAGVNPLGMYNDSTNMFTVPETGWYEINAQFNLNIEINSGVYLEIWYNSAKVDGVISCWSPDNGWNAYSGSNIIYLTAGNSYEFVFKHTDTGYDRNLYDGRATVKKVA